MTYPNSSDVSTGQPTAASHYNNLRKDAVYLGNGSADTRNLQEFMTKFAFNLNLEYLATNRLRVPYNAYKPPLIVIGGCLLKAESNVDLPSASFSGAAATYYIHAVRTAGSNTFTLSVNTSASETDTARVIGTCYWDGSNISSINPYFSNVTGMPQANYDSGWFAVTYATTYNKTHGLGAVPKMYVLYHSTDSAGTSENVVAINSKNGTGLMYGMVGFDSSTAYIQTGVDSTAGTITSTRRVANNGYFRLLAWG